MVRHLAPNGRPSDPIYVRTTWVRIGPRIAPARAPKNARKYVQKNAGMQPAVGASYNLGPPMPRPTNLSIALATCIGALSIGAATACEKDPPPSQPPAHNGLPIEDNGTVGDRQDPDRAEDDAATAPATYDPCAAKTCGDTCTLCDPEDADCMETAVVKQCDPEGQCSQEAVSC